VHELAFNKSKNHHDFICQKLNSIVYKENVLNSRLPERQSAQQAGHLLQRNLLFALQHEKYIESSTKY